MCTFASVLANVQPLAVRMSTCQSDRRMVLFSSGGEMNSPSCAEQLRCRSPSPKIGLVEERVCSVRWCTHSKVSTLDITMISFDVEGFCVQLLLSPVSSLLPPTHAHFEDSSRERQDAPQKPRRRQRTKTRSEGRTPTQLDAHLIFACTPHISKIVKVPH